MLRVDPAHLCPRLIDYLAIVGSRSPKRNQIAQKPELLRCYPIHVHSDFTLPPDVVYFCQPEGCIAATRKHLKSMPNGEESFFVFTLTDKDSGKVRYGACLNFYRSIEREPKSPKRSPKHTTGTSKRPNSNTGNDTVHSAGQRFVAPSDSESEYDDKSGGTKNRKVDGKRQSDLNSKSKGDNVNSHADAASTSGTPKRRARIATHTLTSLCIISHHTFFTAFREVLTGLRRFIEARQTRCNTELGRAARHSPSVWRTLTTVVSSASNAGSSGVAGESTTTPPTPHALVLHDVREIETWIFRLLSAPVPVPGMTRLELFADPEDPERNQLLAYPDNTRLPLIDLPLHLPLELLGVDLYCRLLTCILLEQKVAIQSRDFGALTMTVLSLVASLYPLEYMFTVIPLLPTCMSSAEQLLLVPTPFLIGIPTSFLLYKHQFQLPSDIWLIDLDSRKMFVGSPIELPSLPQPDGNTLRQQLAAVLARIGVNERGTDARSEMHVPQSDGRSHQHVHVAHACTRKSHVHVPASNSHSALSNSHQHELRTEADSDEADVALRAALVRFLGSPNVLGNFAEHTRTLRLYPRPVVAFQCAAFVKSRPRGSSAFTSALARSQAVEYFAEWQLTRADAAQPFVRIAANAGAAASADPQLVGDKPRWYAAQLHPLTFRVSRPPSGAPTGTSSSASLVSAVAQNATTSESGSENEESGEMADGDRPLSSASSFSSLCSFVHELIDAQIGIEAPEPEEIVSPGNAVASDGVCTPPTSLQLPGRANETKPDSEAASAASGQTKVDARPHSTSPALSSSSDGEEQPRAASSAGAYNLQPAGASLRSDGSSNYNSKTGFSSAGPLSPLHNGSQPVSSTSLSNPSSKPGSVSNVSNSASVSVSSSASASVTASGSFGSATKRISSDDSSKQLFSTRSSMSIRQRKQNFSLQLASQAVSSGSSQNGAGSSSNSSWLPFGLSLGALAPASSTSSTLAVSENQQFLKEVVSAVLDGQGVGLLKSNRIRKLMENENYRNFVLSRLNLGMDKRITDPEDHLEDIVTTGAVLKGMLQLSRLILSGLETSYYSAGGSSGGVASAFLLFEIAHTHFAVRGDAAPSANTPMSVTPTAEYPTRLSAIALNGDEFENVDVNVTGKGGSNSSVKIRKSDSTNSDADSATRVSHSPVRDGVSSSDSSLRTGEPSVLLYPAKSRSSGSFRYLQNRLVSTYRSAAVANRLFLFEMLIKERSRLFDDLQFWEDMFLDAVAQERDVVGMDQAPTDLLERYNELSVGERKRLELDEDRLLCALMCNTIAFMTLMRVGLTDTRRKMRRLLGKCHIGLLYSAVINDLLDQLEKLQANDVDLKPPASRLMQKQSFTVHLGTDNSGDMAFLEVCDDCLILRSISGIICDRWWFEKLVNMTYCPRTKVISLWRKLDGQMQDRQFYTKRCQELYQCVKETMQRAAQRTGVQFPAAVDLGGEFPVQSVATGETGTIQVRLDGISVQCGAQSFYVQLHRVKRCATESDGVFLLEVADITSGQVESRYFRSVATSHIVTSLHRVFSYQSAKLQLLRGVASAFVHSDRHLDSASSGSSRFSPANSSSVAATSPNATD